jgi:photosystem II stability/assembly factor-like uncharacterized protein
MRARVRTRSLSIAVILSIVLVCLVAAAPGALGNGVVCPDFFWQNPLPQGNALLDIAVVDANTAWAVGDYGTIFKTTDGGANWQVQSSGTTSVLHAVSAVNTGTAWVCGEDDTVLRTIDGGATWTPLYPDIPGDYMGVSAIDGQTAWVVGTNPGGGLIEKTSDGGETWTDQSPVVGDMCDAFAVDANVVWALSSEGAFFSSTDGGDSWDQATAPGGGLCNRLQAFNATTAYAVSDHGRFIKTTNGTDFTVTDVGQGVDVKSLAFIDQQTGWVVGTKGFIGVTGDAGGHWATQASGVRDALFGVDVTAAGKLYACGQSGQLLRSDQPAGPWVRLSRGDTDLLNSITAAGDRSAWACGDDGTILRTDNGGMTWVKQSPGSTEFLTCIDASSGSVAWAVGENGTIRRTTDAGAIWSAVDPGPGAGSVLISVSALGPDSAWVSGANGLVMKTSDGGATWQELDQGSDDDLKVKALNSQTAYCVRISTNKVTRTDDGGAHWSPQTLRFTGHSVRLNDLCMVNDKVAYATAWVVETHQTGDFGMVFKTADGTGWSATMSRHADLLLDAVSSADGVNVWACGLFGATLRSADGGKTWEQENSLQNDNFFYSAEAVDGQTAWLAGAGGYIVRTTAPYLYSISPSSAMNTGPVDIGELAGNGFQPGMEVKLVRGGGEIPATDVVVRSPYRATCRFDLTGAAEGDWDVVAKNTNGLEGRLRSGFHVSSAKTWYLAEGSTGTSAQGSFETWIELQNPGAAEANAQLTYLTPGGEQPGPQVVLPPRSRSTVNVEDTIPGAWEVSTVVESDKPIVVERAMYWDSQGTYRLSSGGSIGTPFASNRWYLAEGSTGISAPGWFDTYVTVANPGDADSEVALTFMTPNGLVAGPSSVVGPGRRWTVDVSSWVPNEWSVSTRVAGSKPVVAERSIYWNSPTSTREAAHNSIGAAETSTRWFLAEGSTGSAAAGAFETWVVLQNPGNYYANATLFFDTPSGQVAGPTVALGPHSRQSVNVADSVPNQYSVSTRVVADNPVVAERTTIFNSATTYHQAVQSSVGADCPADSWELTEGSTGSGAGGGFETWVVVQNPGAAAAQVTIEYMTPDGIVPGPVLALGAGSRVSVNAADTVPDTWDVSTRVTANAPVVAEEVVYWNAAAVPKLNSHSSVGFPF